LHYAESIMKTLSICMYWGSGILVSFEYFTQQNQPKHLET